MPEQLIDWPEAGFIAHILRQMEAPVGPDRVDEGSGGVVVGEKLWESGAKLFGNQWRVLVDRSRFKQVGGGWRAGKSWVGALHIVMDYLWRTSVRGVNGDRWGVIGDSYAMANEEMRHVHRIFTELGIEHGFRMPERQAWTIDFPHNECVIETLSGRDVMKIASKPYRGMVIAEANQTVYTVFDNARGRVSQTRGWVLMEGTFESEYGGPWYTQNALSWKQEGALGVFYSLPSWGNRVVYPGGRNDPEILENERTRTPTNFWEKYGGEPQRRSDLVMAYADERWHVRHRYPSLETSYDPEQPVYLFSDPGIAHAYAVFAVQFWGYKTAGDWRKGEEVVMEPWSKEKAGGSLADICWVIDVVYRWDRTADQVIRECAGKPWARNVETAVMDFAATQRRAEGPPIVEQWAKGWPEHTGQQLYVVAQPVPLIAGYDIHRRALLNSWPEEEAARMFNGDGRIRGTVTDPEGPRLMIDPGAAGPLFGGDVDGRRYAGEYNLHRNKKNRDGTVTSDEPIDMDNDAIKALNYGLYWHYGPAGQRQRWSAVQSVPWAMSVR